MFKLRFNLRYIFRSVNLLNLILTTTTAAAFCYTVLPNLNVNMNSVLP
jgi:hypothetical protein